MLFFAPVLCEDYAETMRKRGERRGEREEGRGERGELYSHSLETGGL